MPGIAPRKRHRGISSNTTPWLSTMCKTCDVENATQLEEHCNGDTTSDCDRANATLETGSQNGITPIYQSHDAKHRSHKYESINGNIIDVALKVAELVIDPALPKVGISLLSLPTRYRRLDKAAEDAFEQGDMDLSSLKYQHALQLKQRALLFSATAEGQREILADMATSINNLAYMRQERRDTQSQQSLFCYEAVLQIKQYIHGACHISVGFTLNNLGSMHFFVKNYYEAISYFRRARKIFRSILGLEHLDICTVSSNIGDVFYSLENWKRAAIEYRSALRLRWIILGRRDPKVVRLMEVLADAEMKLLESQRKEDESSVPQQLLELDEDCQSDDGSFAAEVDNLHEEISEDLQFFQEFEQEARHKLIRDKVSLLKELRQLRQDDPSMDAPSDKSGAQQQRWLLSESKDSFYTTETSIDSEQSGCTKPSANEARAEALPSSNPRGIEDELDRLLASAIDEVGQAVDDFKNEICETDDSGYTSDSSLSTREPSLQTLPRKSTAQPQSSCPIRALIALATTGFILSNTTSHRCEEATPAQIEASPGETDYSILKEGQVTDPNMGISESCPVKVVTTLATAAFVLQQINTTLSHQENSDHTTDSKSHQREGNPSLLPEMNDQLLHDDGDDDEPTRHGESRSAHPQQGDATSSAMSDYPIKVLTALATTAFVLHHNSNQDNTDSTTTGTSADDDDSNPPVVVLENQGGQQPLVLPDDQQAISPPTDDTLASDTVLHRSLKPLSTYTCLRRSRSGAKQLNHAEREEALQKVRRRLEERRRKRGEISCFQ